MPGTWRPSAFTAGLAVLAVSKGPQSQFRYCWWHGGSHGTDFDISEIANPVVTVEA